MELKEISTATPVEVLQEQVMKKRGCLVPWLKYETSPSLEIEVLFISQIP